MFVYMRRMIISPKLKREVGIFQKGKIRRDFATREIQIKVHVTCVTFRPPPSICYPPKTCCEKFNFTQKITMLQMNIYDFHEALTLPVYPQLRQSQLEF